MFEYPKEDPDERQARKLKHTAWLKSQHPEYAHRVELVRRYLLNPAGWADGHCLAVHLSASAQAADTDAGVSRYGKRLGMNTLLLAGIAALLMATGTAHADNEK